MEKSREEKNEVVEIAYKEALGALVVLIFVIIVAAIVMWHFKDDVDTTTGIAPTTMSTSK